VSYLGIVLTFSLVNNVVLSELLGICPCITERRPLVSSIMTASATIFLMTASAVATWALRALVLQPLGLQVLQIFVFVIAVFLLAEVHDFLLRIIGPGLLRDAGFSVPALGANCAVLGTAFIASRAAFGPVESFFAGVSAGLGFFIATLLLSAVAERVDQEAVPRPIRGTPILLISTGLVALAFLALDAVFVKNLVG
jgi:electron transport complex protein RnfA